MKKHNIKLLALDMDGTLLDRGNHLPEGFKDWVKVHSEIQTVIASGRQYYILKEMFQEISDHLIYIVDNGGFIFWKEKMIYSDIMDVRDLKQCIERFKFIDGCHVILCGEKSAYMETSSEKIKNICRRYFRKLKFVESFHDCFEKDIFAKITLFEEYGKAEKLYGDILLLPGDFSATLSGKNWVDISNNSVTKGTAVKVIQQMLQISRSESMAFGDYLNDYDLLLSCEESYAMKNAHPKLKEMAKYVTEATNNEDGVMRVLRKI